MTTELERMIDQQTSSHLGRMSTIIGFISLSLTPITSKWYYKQDGRLVCTSFSQHVEMTSSLSYRVTLYDTIWFYLSFYWLYNNQTYQDGKPTCNNFRLQVRMTPFLAISLIILYCKDKTWQGCRPAYTCINQQVIINSPPMASFKVAETCY